MELDALPYGLADMPSIRRLYDMYVETYEQRINEPPITNNDEEQKFTQSLKARLSKHAHVIPTLCAGLIELEESDPVFDIQECHWLTDYLDRIGRERVGIRLLLGVCVFFIFFFFHFFYFIAKLRKN